VTWKRIQEVLGRPDSLPCTEGSQVWAMDVQHVKMSITEAAHTDFVFPEETSNGKR